MRRINSRLGVVIMTTNKREAFEKWATSENHYCRLKPSGDYDELDIQYMWEAWQARDALDQRQKVTDEMASKILLSLPNFAKYNHSESEWAEDVSVMRAALQSIAQPVMVPDAKEPMTAQDEAYADGWNACREAMLFTSPQP